MEDPDQLTNIYLSLSEKIHPLSLGEVYRSKSQIQMLAKKLLKYQDLGEDKEKEIIKFLCSDSGSHDYTIYRNEANEELGLNIPAPYTQPIAMQFYLEGAIFIGNSPLFKPVGKDIIGYDMFPDPRVSILNHPSSCFPDPLKRVGHQLWMQYGTCQSNVPIEV